MIRVTFSNNIHIFVLFFFNATQVVHNLCLFDSEYWHATRLHLLALSHYFN